MNEAFDDKRKASRYETEVKVYFHYPYDIQTKVDYQLADKEYKKILSPKYTGVSRNVSAEGLCFHSDKELGSSDNLLIELHLPGDKAAVLLEGKVRWCHASEEKGFDTGVHLMTVNGKAVRETVYFDETYHVEWSAVLDAILGKYRILSQKKSNETGI